MSRPLRDDFGNQIHTRQVWKENALRQADPSHADQDENPDWDEDVDEDEDMDDDEDKNE